MKEWISVDKEFPPHFKDVLAFDGQMYVAQYFGDPKDWRYSDCCGCSANGVTHWKELPEPPRGG